MTQIPSQPEDLTFDREVRMKTPDGNPLNQLVIVFAITRSKIHSLNVSGDGFQSHATPVIDNILYAAPNQHETLHSRQNISISITYTGEPPIIADILWRATADKEIADELKLIRSADEAFLLRRRLICTFDHLPEPRNPHPNGSKIADRLWFFHEFDELTVPKGAEAAHGITKSNYNSFKSVLQRRIIQRADPTSRNSDIGMNDGLYSQLTAKNLSQIVCSIFARRFSILSPQVIDDYFESFASGDLAMGHLRPEQSQLRTQGVPNGAFYLLLAEASFFYTRTHSSCSKREAEWWKACQHTFVRTADIVIEHQYDGKRRSWSNYAYPCDRNLPPFSATAREALRDKYSNVLDIEDEFTKVCRKAFADEKR